MLLGIYHTEIDNVIYKVTELIQNGPQLNQISVKRAEQVIPPGQHDIVFDKCRSKADHAKLIEIKRLCLKIWSSYKGHNQYLQGQTAVWAWGQYADHIEYIKRRSWHSNFEGTHGIQKA